MSRRTEKLGSTIRQELMQIIQRHMNDPRLMGLPSITRVKVAEDLSTADVFVTIMGTPGQQTAALNALKHSAGMMRGKLMKSLSIRQVPYLNFQVDEQLRKELEILELLQKVADENAEIDRRRAAEAAAAGGGEGAGADAGVQPPAGPGPEPDAAGGAEIDDAGGPAEERQQEP